MAAYASDCREERETKNQVMGIGGTGSIAADLTLTLSGIDDKLELRLHYYFFKNFPKNTSTNYHKEMNQTKEYSCRRMTRNCS